MRTVNNKNAKLLKILEPEDVGTSISIDADKIVKVRNTPDGGFSAGMVSEPIQTRDEGEFAGKAFYLNNTFDWEFGHDSFGLLVIVPLKKGIAEMYEHEGEKPIG
jgi:hypothetical protein